MDVLGSGVLVVGGGDTEKVRGSVTHRRHIGELLEFPDLLG